MLKRIIFLCVAFSFVLVSVVSFAGEQNPGREISEKLIFQMYSSSFIEDSFMTSPDNKHAAYEAESGNKSFIVVDGKEEKQYDGIGETFIFSPDSKHLAYGAESGNKWFIVVDGKEGKQYDSIVDLTLIFSPDSKHLAYIAKSGNKYFAVVDGKEGKQYDGIIETIIFSSDSRHVAYEAESGNKWFIVVDGKEGKQYDGFIAARFGGKVVFDTPDSLHYLAIKGSSIYLVEEKRR